MFKDLQDQIDKVRNELYAVSTCISKNYRLHKSMHVFYGGMVSQILHFICVKTLQFRNFPSLSVQFGILLSRLTNNLLIIRDIYVDLVNKK